MRNTPPPMCRSGFQRSPPCTLPVSWRGSRTTAPRFAIPEPICWHPCSIPCPLWTINVPCNTTTILAAPGEPLFLCPDAGRKEGKLKRPLAYITAHWGESTDENMKLAAKYCRAVYDAGYQPICPLVMHSLFLRDAIPQEHKDNLDMSKDYLYIVLSDNSITTRFLTLWLTFSPA